MTKPLKSIPCVEIPIKFLATPFVSELNHEIIEWFDAQGFVWKLSYLSGQYSIIFSEHSEALLFKLKMGHWEDTLKEPDFLSTTGNVFTSWLPSQSTMNWPVHTTGSGGAGYATGGMVSSGGNGGYSYTVGGGGGAAGVSGNVQVISTEEEFIQTFGKPYFEYDTGIVVSGKPIKGSGI